MGAIAIPHSLENIDATYLEIVIDISGKNATTICVSWILKPAEPMIY